MANQYRQVVVRPEEAHFSQGTASELEFSSFNPDPVTLTTFNAGEIVPIFCCEVLPHDTLGMSLDFVIRQSTLSTPTMGNMEVDYYAYFVPNRIVNQSFKSAMGENPNGSWTATEVTLAPLYDRSKINGTPPSLLQIPVGSIADHYGFPTQTRIPVSVLEQCHDLKFRGYIEIYNNYFRDQNYQPPIPYSKLNVYEGFFSSSSGYTMGNLGGAVVAQDNTYGSGSITQAVFGNLPATSSGVVTVGGGSLRFNALGNPLKANKLHDYFTSVLPSTQKGPLALVPIGLDSKIPVRSRNDIVNVGEEDVGVQIRSSSTYSSNGTYDLALNGTGGQTIAPLVRHLISEASLPSTSSPLYFSNLFAVPEAGSLSLTINDFRQAAAIQQVYEALAKSGSRYFEYVRAFFGLDVDNPYKDIPTELGHFRRRLDLYQTAQTAPSQEGSTPQGNLAAFGYTDNSGVLFPDTTFLEHGYVHVLAVVRHKNVYTSYLSKDNFRRSMLDFYQPQLANLSEQPVKTIEINPFFAGSTTIFGYQEPYAEYRFFPDTVSGYMRTGITQSLSVWNYADDFSTGLSIATGDWLKSNSKEVLDRTLAVDSTKAPQFKAQFGFRMHFTRPMPLFGVNGMDII